MIITPPKPIRAIVPKMCARCPFRPDGSGYAQDHPDLPRIVAAVEHGLPFMCHETALKDPRTRLNAQGDPDGIQDHMELCRGGHAHRMKVWRDKVIAAGHTPGEEAPEPSPFKYDRFEDCPDARKHTKQPAGYIERSDWAERKLKTHDCHRCPTCGFWVMWKRRPKGAPAPVIERGPTVTVSVERLRLRVNDREYTIGKGGELLGEKFTRRRRRP